MLYQIEQVLCGRHTNENDVQVKSAAANRMCCAHFLRRRRDFPIDSDRYNVDQLLGALMPAFLLSVLRQLQEDSHSVRIMMEYYNL